MKAAQQQDNPMRQVRPSQLSHDVRSRLAALLLLTATACNRYHSSISINPKTELDRSTQVVQAGKATFHVPADWTLHDVLRDPDLPGASIVLTRFNGRKVLGNMNVIAQQSKPDWLNGSDVKTIST